MIPAMSAIEYPIYGPAILYRSGITYAAPLGGAEQTPRAGS